MGVVDIDLGHWLTLALTPGIGPRTARTLLSAFGSPEAVVTASRASLERAIPTRAAAAVLAGPRSGAVETALAWAAEEGNHILTLADDAYPRPLLETADPPILL
ncbi:MAG: DNA-protecting protein DprA, partial [Burkholderiales bacterium]|nr:DNA-protecting protein DprA [Burkholderiales bacterium]